MAAAKPIIGERRMSRFKWLVYSLLSCNLVYYLSGSTVREAVDYSGWVLLLIAFEWQERGLVAGESGSRLGLGQQRLVLGLQLAGYTLATFACGAYFQAGEWLDFANALLWLVVCAVLVFDLYWPGHYGSRGWRLRNAGKILLYAGLIGIAISFGLTADWMDFYDAILWLLCFFVIELKLFTLEAPIPQQSDISG
jgi:hypothetical protein